MFLTRLSEQEISQIRAKTDIVGVIGCHVPLTRKGKNYKCVYPSHDDRDPSMSIATDKQIYKCFVCGVGGNVFMFVQDHEKVSFIEVVYKVAEYAGVTLEHTLNVTPRIRDPHLQALHKACREAVEFTHYQLDTLDAKNVKGYLMGRSITEEIIKRFEIGYNPMGDTLYHFLHAKKHADDDLVSAGSIHVTSLGMKDAFSHRIMIPIHDGFGESVGFTAQRVAENEEAKCINATEADIHKKGNLIFNYHRAKQEARKAKKIYLVGGAMDVLALEKVELHNIVATLGTAIAKEQLRLLQLLHVPIVVCYGGDKTSRNATYKFGKMAREAQLSLEIVDNKYGLDPGEVIDVYGKDELRALLDKTISWVDFLFEYLLRRYNLDNYSQKKEFAQEMALEIQALQDDFEKQSYFIRLRELTEFDVQVEQPKEEHRTIHQPQPPWQSFLTFPKSGRSHAERKILSQMLDGIAVNNLFKEEPGLLKDNTDSKLAMYIIDYYRARTALAVAELLDVIREEDVKALLLETTNWELVREDVDMAVLQETIVKGKSCFLDSKIQLLNKEVRSVNDPMEKAKFAVEKNQLIKEREE